MTAAAATHLFDVDVDEQLTKIKTSHSSDAVRAYKHVSEKKLASLMDIVACNSRKSDADRSMPLSSVSHCDNMQSASSVVTICSASSSVVRTSTGIGSGGLPMIFFGNIMGAGVTINVHVNNA